MKKIIKMKDMRGINDATLEKALNLKPKTIYDWKRGNKTYFQLLPEIANFFDVSIDWLFGRGEEYKVPISEISEIQAIYDEISETGKNRLLGIAQGIYLAEKSEMPNFKNIQARKGTK